MTNPFDFQAFLTSTLADFACQTGTIHRTRPDGNTLEIIAKAGIPEALMEKIALIPFGKGIAGAAAESRQPVELCNLQQDLGGVAKPDARSTGVAGSLAVPIFSPDGNVIGTLGIGKFTPYEFSDAEKSDLAQRATTLATALIAER